MCFAQFNFQANRLRRLPAASSNPLSGFQILHAFGMHFHWRRSRLYTRIVVFSLATLYPLILHAIIHLWTCRSYETRRLYNTAHRGMQAVPLFCKISVSTWTRLHVLTLLLLSCEYLHLLAACACFETKFVERTREECLNATVHLQSSLAVTLSC